MSDIFDAAVMNGPVDREEFIVWAGIRVSQKGEKKATNAPFREPKSHRPGVKRSTRGSAPHNVCR